MSGASHPLKVENLAADAGCQIMRGELTNALTFRVKQKP